MINNPTDTTEVEGWTSIFLLKRSRHLMFAELRVPGLPVIHQESIPSWNTPGDVDPRKKGTFCCWETVFL